MPTAIENDDSSIFVLPSPDSHSKSFSELGAASPPINDWWSQPRGTRSRVSTSASLGHAGFASFREAGLGIDDPAATPASKPSLPINISTPNRASRTPSSLSPANSSPASVFLTSLASPRSISPDDEGQTADGYVLGRTIGRGAFAVVKKATNADTGSVVAIKIIKKNQPAAVASELEKQIKSETAIWFNLSHKNILPLFSIFDTPYAAFLVMLYCPAGSLLEAITKDGSSGLPQDRAGPLLAQVVQGMKYLHIVARLVHGDLKLENILIDEKGSCRIADFGLSREIGAPAISRPVTPPEERMSGQCQLLRARTMPRHHRNSSPLPQRRAGLDSHPKHNFPPGSLAYAAPELLRPSTSDVDVADPAQDIWALGCIIYALFTGRLPFIDSYQPRLQMKIVRGAWDAPPGLGRRATALLKGCLEMDVAERLSIEDVEQDEWMIRWKDADRSPGRNGIRTRSTSRGRYRSASKDGSGSRSSQGRDSSPEVLRSLSRDGRSVPRRAPLRSRSPEDSLPPLSPPLLFERRGRTGDLFAPSSSRSPSLGTPGTPIDGQSPLSHVRHSRHSPGDGRRYAISPLSIAPGMTALEKGVAALMHDSPSDAEHRGRRLTPRQVGPISPHRTSSTPRQQLKVSVGAKDDLAVRRGRRSKERSSGKTRDYKRSQSLGYAAGQRDASPTKGDWR